ncbi:MAG: hypothetical protein GX981_02235 [Tissierellia bacterium]|nr:hypothetical protein [Tissierellia bacterium]
MNISVVKNNMYQSYSSCTILENNLSQLISILNSVDDSNAYIVSQYISTIDYTMNTVKRKFERMLQVNRVELHILFSEFNNKSNDMIMKLNKLSSDLKRLSVMADELYALYKLAESMEFYLEYFLSANSLRRFIPNIVKVKNELLIFKMMIDTNNRKLRVGVRK